jgi:hypothetical protein
MEKKEDNVSHLQSMLFRSIELNLARKDYSAVKAACKLLIETNMSDWIFVGYGCIDHKE